MTEIALSKPQRIELRPGRTFHAPTVASPEGNVFDLRLWNDAGGSANTSMIAFPPTNAPVSESTLFESRLAIKVQIANVAMHISDDWRKSIFRQLDNLLETDEWDREQPLPNGASVVTFLRLITFLQFQKRPSLSFYLGNVLASWMERDARATLECRANDQVRWVVALTNSKPVETASGLCVLKRLPTVLATWSASTWLFNDSDK